MIRLRIVPALAMCALGMVFSGIASAQAKVAIINIQRAVLETADIKKASAELQAKYKPKADALAKVQQDLNDLQAQLQGAQGKLSQAGLTDLESRSARKQKEAERLNEDLQADVDRERNDILQKAQTRMDAVIKKIAEEQNIDVIVDTTNAVYYKPALEITTQVITAYDKAYPVK